MDLSGELDYLEKWHWQTCEESSDEEKHLSPEHIRQSSDQGSREETEEPLDSHHYSIHEKSLLLESWFEYLIKVNSTLLDQDKVG